MAVVALVRRAKSVGVAARAAGALELVQREVRIRLTNRWSRPNARTTDLLTGKAPGRPLLHMAIRGLTSEVRGQTPKV